MPDITSATTARVLYEDVICKHGCFKWLLSDRAAAFNSAVMKELWKLIGAKKANTASYAPSTNGQLERSNQTLIRALSMYTSKNQDDWDEYLASIAFGFNISPATSTTRHSAFFLLYGRNPLLPIDISLMVEPEEVATARKHLPTVVKNLEIFHKVAKDNMQIAKEKMKEYYDRNCKQTTFELGDHVWVYIPVTKVKMSKKLAHHWVGPYYLVEKITPVTFRVRTAENKLVKGPVHVNRMKPFLHREDRPIGLPGQQIGEPLDIDEDLIPLDSFANDQTKNANGRRPENDKHDNDNNEDNDKNDYNDDNDDNDTDDGESVYEVDQILKRRLNKGKLEFRIRWKGFGPEFDTWEPEENIFDKDMVREYNEKNPPRPRGRPRKV